MFEFLGAWLLGFWAASEEVLTVQSSQLSPWFAQTSLPALIAPTYRPDEKAIATLNQYLASLERSGFELTEQGIWLQSGANVWGEHQGNVALPAASLTKLVTSLMALETWGTNHQFETMISTTGPLQNGVLQGNLVIQGGGDPLYVWEEAIVLANVLQQEMGIQAIAGDLLIGNNFSMNYQESPLKSGILLRQAFDSALWPPEAEKQYLEMPAGTPKPRLSVQGQVQYSSKDALGQRSLTPIVRQQSLPLAQLLKLMNIYSNNVMSQALADMIGGADEMSRKAAELVQVAPEEIQLINGSGLGTDNQLSPRAVSKILIALSQKVAGTSWSVADLLPVSGRDIGTLKGRNVPRSAAVKTGSLWNVSSLAGGLPTEDYGVVWFTIINRGGDLDGLRRRQDIMLNALLQDWGQPGALPADLQPGTESLKPENQLGARSRIQILNGQL
ncbi:MAG: D-alanyl-D-alanine carboxypeptidase [Cyanobacteria bacterium P01_F01_bin.150]